MFWLMLYDKRSGLSSICLQAPWEVVEHFKPLHEFPDPCVWSHCNVCTIFSVAVAVQ